MIRVGREYDRRPPQEYSRFLREAGGLNPYGGQNFILTWGESRGSFTPHGVVPCQNGSPEWCLSMWRPAWDLGSPANWDYELLGPYPSRGWYDIIQPLGVNSPLSFRTLELMVPIIRRHLYDTAEQRNRLLRAERDREDRALQQRIADCLQDAFPAFAGAESFSGTPNSVVRKRIEQIERTLGWAPPRRLSIA